MKKIFSIFAMAAVAASSMAQASASFVKHNNGGDVNWSINLLGMSAVNSDRSTKISLHYDDSDYCTPGFYFGISNVASDDVKFKPGNSLEFGFTPFDFAWWNNSKNFGIISGIGISWTRYAFSDKEAIIDINRIIDDPVKSGFCLAPLPEQYSNPRMTYASWRLPVEFAISSKNCLFTAGVEGELRHHLRMRTKLGKNKKHYLTSHDMGVNPFGLNAVASIGCKGVSLYGRVALTEFFNKNEIDVTGTPFMVGLRFYTR